VRLAALILEVDLRVYPGISGSGTVISGILRFHLNSRVSHFLLNVTFLCKLRRIHVYDVHGIHACHYSRHRSTFGMLRNRYWLS